MTGTPPLLDAFIAAWDQADRPDRARVAERILAELGDGPGEQLLDAKTRAAQLHLSPEALSRMARQGRVPGAKLIGGKWLFPADCTVTPPRGDPPAIDPPRRPGAGLAGTAAAAIRGA